jgi:hypothetical protein
MSAASAISSSYFFVTYYSHCGIFKPMNRGRVTLFFLISVVAFAFLVYTLLNLDALGITVTHPRVIIEAGITFLGLLLSIRETRR